MDALRRARAAAELAALIPEDAFKLPSARAAFTADEALRLPRVRAASIADEALRFPRVRLALTPALALTSAERFAAAARCKALDVGPVAGRAFSRSEAVLRWSADALLRMPALR